MGCGIPEFGMANNDWELSTSGRDNQLPFAQKSTMSVMYGKMI